MAAPPAAARVGGMTPVPSDSSRGVGGGGEGVAGVASSVAPGVASTDTPEPAGTLSTCATRWPGSTSSRLSHGVVEPTGPVTHSGLPSSKGATTWTSTFLASTSHRLPIVSQSRAVPCTTPGRS